MRISEIELQTEDIMWFAVDLNNYIIACTSAGISDVPEFVCADREETELLEDYFMNSLQNVTNEILHADYIDNDLMNDGIVLAKKGIFCFDAVSNDINHNREYIKLISPEKPIDYNSLPSEIRNILKKHLLKVDAAKLNYLKVENAY